MKNLWPVLRGILIALASLGLLFGGLSLSLAEGNMSNTIPSAIPPSPSATPSATSTKKFIIDTNSPQKPISTETDSPTPLPSTATATPTQPPTPTNCPPPSGWVAYVVQPGDTLAILSTRYRISSTTLKQSNCLLKSELKAGSIIYVPPLPTQTRVPCGPPRGWIAFMVQPGDTLYRLSQAYGITVADLQRANCMGSTTLLQVGKTIYVPPWAPHTPTPIFPGGDTPTYVPTDTLSNYTPPDTPTETSTEVPPNTETPLPSDTPASN